MSGICGVIRLDGPVDAAALERMTTDLEARGPDGRATWAGEAAGFGHTLLQTCDDVTDDRQPCTLDGRAWIVADARIDARAELHAALRAAGTHAPRDASDAQLILIAYRAWGPACAERLRGDFAFSIWDEPRRSLFCARDPLGVKPFFYARAGAGLVFANSLACLRRHGAIDDRLDELAIADFLLFEMSQEPSATAFAAIRRLPPAHSLEFSAQGLRIRRYWKLAPSDMPIYRREGDYVERFDELLDAAVADRMRARRVAVLMSGGLDSPALAAAAKRRGADVSAFASVYDHLIPDEERYYSNLAARGVGVPIFHRNCDAYELFESYAQLKHHFPEPVNAPFAAIDIDLAADAAGHARVALTGWDGDALLSESPRPYFRMLATQQRWGRLAAAAGRFVLDNPGSAWRSAWHRVAPPRDRPTARYWPHWLEDEFASRLRLRERWQEAVHAPAVKPDPLRPHAHRTFDYLARLSSFFEASDASRTGVALEMRHPFMDLRLVEFCLSLPPVPWCVRKEILRRWLQGRVPEAVRMRPKTPLAGFPHVEALKRPASQWLRRIELCGEAAAFIDQGKMVSMEHDGNAEVAWANLRPASLNLWFRHARTA